MPDNAVAGYLGTFYASDDGGATYTAIDMRDFKPTRTRKTIDTTTHADAGAESFKSSTKSWTASLDILWLTGDAGRAKLTAAYEAATTLKFRFDPEGTATGKPRLSGDGIIESIAGPDSPVSGVVAETVTIKGSGNLAEGTQ